jgi:hypothetical protein
MDRGEAVAELTIPRIRPENRKTTGRALPVVSEVYI